MAEADDETLSGTVAAAAIYSDRQATGARKSTPSVFCLSELRRGRGAQSLVQLPTVVSTKSIVSLWTVSFVPSC